MILTKELDLGAYIKESIHNMRGIGYFLRSPRAFQESLMMALASSRVRIEGFQLFASENPKFPFFFHPEFEWWCRHMLDNPFGRRIVQFVYSEWLDKCENFLPPSIFALLWAFEKTQNDFVEQAIPLWSNEERLTGSLLRSVTANLSIFNDCFEKLAQTPVKPIINFFIADIATGRRESGTGGDFGIVLDLDIPGEPKLIRACRFQAKKAYSGGSCTINLDQIEKLLEWEGLGNLILYHQLDEKKAAPPPTVLSLKNWKGEIENRRVEIEKKNASIRHGDEIKLGNYPLEDARNKGIEFAFFIVLGLADLAGSEGCNFDNPRDAIKKLIGIQSGLSPVSYVLAISLGKGPEDAQGKSISWAELFSQFKESISSPQ